MRKRSRGTAGAGAGIVLLLLLSSAVALGQRAPAGAGVLEPGLRVEVKGKRIADGSLLADEVELRRESDDDEELRGNLESVDLESGRLRLLGFEVVVESGTPLLEDDGGPADPARLVPGLRVKVDGARDAAGRFVARKLRIRANQYRETKLVGAIEEVRRIAGGLLMMRVVGVEVLLNDATDLIGFAAGSGTDRRRRLGVIDDEDVQITGRLRFGENAVLGGEFRLRAESLEDLDLGEQDLPRQTTPEVFGIVGLAFEHGRFFSYIEVEGAREYLISGGPGLGLDSESRSRLEIGEAYGQWDLLASRRLSVAVGRQKFNEKREWYYNDKHVDALRVSYSARDWSIEASISRNLFNEGKYLPEQERVNTILHGTWIAGDETTVEGFYIRREDTTDREDSPKYFGLRALGEWGRHVEYWADAALARGRRGRIAAGESDYMVLPVRAWAYDAGLTVRSRWRWDPSLTISHAAATGDDPATPDVDEEFRQTGLHRNRDHWRGVVSFRYYGELLDPDLQNMSVFTAAFGLRPTRSVSLDLIYHSYEQEFPSRRGFETDLDQRPEGLETQIGTELDLALGYEPHQGLELRLTAGRFAPGAAFAADAREATVIRMQAKLRF